MSAEPVEKKPRVRPGTDPAQCRRRWFAVDPYCDCSDCLPIARRIAKLRRNTMLPPTRSDEAWAAVERMLTNGWTIGSIAAAADIDAAGLSVDRQRNLRKGGVTLGRVRAERLIAAEHKAPPSGRVSSLVARRQLQALSAIGWSLPELEARCGIPWQTLHSIRGGIVQITDVSRVTEVDRLYRELSMTVGTNVRTRRGAARKGWAPPLAWDDITDPTEKPQGVKRG